MKHKIPFSIRLDINECDQNPCRRNQRCINTNGSYKCENLLQCSGGYTASDDGTRCEGEQIYLYIFI